MGSIGSLSELRAALWRQAWLILLVLALGLPAAYWYARNQPRIYEATGVLRVQGPQGGVALSGQSSPDVGIGRRMDELQQALLSRHNLAALMERHGLFPDVESEILRLSLTRGAISFNRLMDPAQAWGPDMQPYGLAISVRHEDPEKAAEVVNALLDSVVAQDTERTSARQAASLEHLDSILGYLMAEERRVSAEVDAVEAEIAQYRAAHAKSLPENLAYQREQLTEFEERRSALNREIEDFERTLSQRPSDAVERRRAELDAQREDLLAEIAEIEAALTNAPEVERDLGALTRRRGNLVTELDAIVTERTRASISQSLTVNSQAPQLVVLETALPPEFPISRSRRKIAMAGAVAVAGLALGLALAREVLHPAIRTAAQMQRQLDIAPVVVIPYVASPPGSRWRLGLGAGVFGLVLLALAVGSAQGGRLPTGAIQDLWPGRLSAWLGGSDPQ